MKLFENINSDSLLKLAQTTIRIGDVYRSTMTIANGIIPKQGDTSRDKFFIVLGFDKDGNIYGGVIINSNINQHLPEHIKRLHMPISKSKYSFLHHNSFVDCSSLKILSPKKFADWSYLGEIASDDIELIKGTLKQSPIESKDRLKQFGI